MLNLKVLSTGSKGNCYLLSTENETLVLDCGVPIKEIKKALDFNVARICGVLSTHGHQDHCKSEPDFTNMGIQVFRPYDEQIACSLATKCGPFMVQAFKLPHNGAPNYGFLITVDGQKILYMTDFEYCQYTFKNQKINHILIECNYQNKYVNRDLPNYEHKIRGHCELETCKGFIETNKSEELKSVLLLHMGGGTCDPTECVEEIRKITDANVRVDYARKGLGLELN